MNINEKLDDLGKQYDKTADFIDETEKYIEECIISPKGVKGREKAFSYVETSIKKLKSLEKSILEIADYERSDVEDKELRQIHRMATNLTRQIKELKKKVKEIRSFKVLGYVNLKGGIGKTSITYTTSTYLAKHKDKKILIIDLDHQGNTSNAFDPPPTDSFEYEFDYDYKIDRTNTKRLFEYGLEASELIDNTSFNNIDVIGGGYTLTETEIALTRKTGREFILRNWINDNVEYLNKNYDYIFLDFSPNFNLLNINGFMVVHSIILISAPDRFSLESIRQFQKLYTMIIKDLINRKKKFAFLINRADRTTNKSKNFIEFMRNHPEYKDVLLNQVIHEAAELQYALEDTRVISEKKNKGLFNEYKTHIENLEERGIL